MIKNFQFKNIDFLIRNRFISNSTRKGQLPIKILGNKKHFPPAVKEWSDSIYNFNKNNLKHSFVKRNIINNLIKSYFYFYDKKQVIKSKRIRKLMGYKSFNNIWVSKPEIKHINDKIIVNIFTYNKMSRYNIRSLYFNNTNINIFNKWLNKQFLDKNRNKYTNVNIFKNKIEFNQDNSTIINKYISLPNIYTKLRKNNNLKKNILNIRLKKNLSNLKFYYMQNIKRLNNISFKKFLNFLIWRKQLKTKFSYNKSIKLNNEKNIMLYRSTYLKKNNIKYIQKLFIYYFLISVLSIFNLKTSLSYVNKYKYLIKVTNKSNIYYSILNNKITKSNLIETNLDNINFLLWNFLKNIFSKTGIYNFDIKLLSLFKVFYINYFNKIFTNLLKNNILNNINYLRFMLNNYKYGKFLRFLKNIIYNIYNKKVDINITNIKYPQLNSDIITNIMTKKLKRKKGTYRKIIEKSMFLAKLPASIFNKEILPKVSNITLLDFYQSTKVHKKLNILLDKIYPSHLLKKNNNKLEYGKIKFTKNTGKVSNILNNIKYKWITGIRLETAGRLTRRFTASRSLFRYKQKGSLKNIDFYSINGKIKPNSTILLRNYVRANCQYTLENSKKRIGAFNIKTWISSY